MNLITESEISAAVGTGQKAVRLQAVKNQWPSVRRKKQGGSERFFVRDLLPVDVRQQIVNRQTAGGNLPAPYLSDTPVPKKANKIGLAKYTLVHAFRVTKERAPWGKKREAIDAFLLSYNAGVLLPSIYETIGEIKERTIDSLDKKLRDHDDNYLCLCDGRGGWKKHGTTKYKGRKLSEAAKAVFLKCYLHPHRPSVIMAIRAARMTLKKQGMAEPADDSTFRRWLKDYEKFNAGVICLSREGMKAYQDRFGTYISRDASLLSVGQCLVADGKTLNFNIIHPDTGRPARMALIVFFDWASRYPCGWQIMPTENTISILAAFRNAVQTLGRYPDSVYLDNGRAFKSKLFMETDPDFTEMTGLYARVGTAVFFAKPYNGRSKVVERFFKTFQDQFEFIMPSYCGDSIATKPAWMHRNEKFHKAWHKARTRNWVPTIRDAALFIEAYITWYAKQIHSGLKAAPADVFMPERGPGVDTVQLNHDFLLRKMVSPRNCRVTLWNIDYESDCLHNLSRNEKICAMVDTADLNRIWCYTKDGIYLGEAYPVAACHPLAKTFADQASLDRVMAENKRQARLAKSTKKQLAALGVTRTSADSLNILPFNHKAPILPEKKEKPGTEKPARLSKTEVKRLEAVVEQAANEQANEPKIQKPKYWASDLAHYEWCFQVIHAHGQVVDDADADFMTDFETRPEYENYRQRFEDLKSIL